jgi:hypothetical protein
MKLKEDIKPATLRDAAILLRLAAQGEQDFQHGRFLPQEEALSCVYSRLKK